jgi:hypothetical protein
VVTLLERHVRGIIDLDLAMAGELDEWHDPQVPVLALRTLHERDRTCEARRMRAIVWVGIVMACGGDKGACGAHGESPVFPDSPPDALPPDAAPPRTLDEAPDCGGDPIVARTGDLQLVVTALVIPALGESFDLDGDGQQDNKLSAMSSLVAGPIQDQIAAGTYVAPIEIFDRDGDPDVCVKLALYRGSCVGTCNFADGTQDTVSLDVASFEPGGAPISRMRSMSTGNSGELNAEPGILHFQVPIDGAAAPLVFPVTVQLISGTLGAGGLADVMVGGTIQAFQLDRVLAPLIEQIGVAPGDTMLDAIFANLLGPLLALPRHPTLVGCRTADIDVDGDGLEAFCDSNPDDDIKRVDTCIDGDGTVIVDALDGNGGIASCTEALLPSGVRRFPDGVSAAFRLDAGPVTIAP